MDKAATLQQLQAENAQLKAALARSQQHSQQQHQAAKKQENAFKKSVAHYKKIVSVQEQTIVSKEQALVEKNQALVEKEQSIAKKTSTIQQLHELILQLRHNAYGSRSEVNYQQASLFDEPECDQDSDNHCADTHAQDTVVTVTAHSRKTKPRSLPPELPREDIIYDVDDADKICPHDGTELKHIGEATHEQLDIIPAQIKVLRHRQQKYACPCCEQHIITAKKPKQAIDKSIASAGLLTHIALSKYADGLPLYRQQQQFKRIGVTLDRTSLANWMVQCGQLIQPLINLLHDHLQQQPVIHLDETRVQVLNEANKTAQSQSYMWVQASTHQHPQPIILFNYHPSRSQQVPLNLLTAASVQGEPQAIMVDGYEGYQKACDEYQLTRLGC